MLNTRTELTVFQVHYKRRALGCESILYDKISVYIYNMHALYALSNKSLLHHGVLLSITSLVFRYSSRGFVKWLPDHRGKCYWSKIRWVNRFIYQFTMGAIQTGRSKQFFNKQSWLLLVYLSLL